MFNTIFIFYLTIELWNRKRFDKISEHSAEFKEILKQIKRIDRSNIIETSSLYRNKTPYHIRMDLQRLETKQLPAKIELFHNPHLKRQKEDYLNPFLSPLIRTNQLRYNLTRASLQEDVKNESSQNKEIIDDQNEKNEL